MSHDIKIYFYLFQWAVSLLEKYKEIEKEKKENPQENEMQLTEVTDQEAQEFLTKKDEINENDSTKTDSKKINFVSKRYLSKILKRVPSLSDTPKCDIDKDSDSGSSSNINKTKDMVQIRIKR